MNRAVNSTSEKLGPDFLFGRTLSYLLVGIGMGLMSFSVLGFPIAVLIVFLERSIWWNT